jgi:hypothetical protein
MSKNSLSINQSAGKLKLKDLPFHFQIAGSNFTASHGNRLAGDGGGISMT